MVASGTVYRIPPEMTLKKFKVSLSYDEFTFKKDGLLLTRSDTDIGGF